MHNSTSDHDSTPQINTSRATTIHLTSRHGSTPFHNTSATYQGRSHLDDRSRRIRSLQLKARLHPKPQQNTSGHYSTSRHLTTQPYIARRQRTTGHNNPLHHTTRRRTSYQGTAAQLSTAHHVRTLRHTSLLDDDRDDSFGQSGNFDFLHASFYYHVNIF